MSYKDNESNVQLTISDLGTAKYVSIQSIVDRLVKLLLALFSTQ
jgi:hypothetical protein